MGVLGITVIKCFILHCYSVIRACGIIDLRSGDVLVDEIIEEIKEFALFGRYRLPISVKKVYVREYAQSTRILAEDEMIFEAKRTLDETLRSEFRDADVVKMKTTGEFSNSTYRLTTRVVYVTDIGKERAIEIS